MLSIKDYNYNQYNLSLYVNGEILIVDEPYEILVIDIADAPIINELIKDLLKYYVEWKKCQIKRFQY